MWAKSSMSLTTLVTGIRAHAYGFTSEVLEAQVADLRALPLWFPFLVFFPFVIVLTAFSFPHCHLFFGFSFFLFFPLLHSVRGLFLL